MSPFHLSLTLLVGGGLLVPYSLSDSPVIKQLMQMVTMVPVQGGCFQSLCLDSRGLWGVGRGWEYLTLALLPLLSAIINPKQSKDAPKSFTFDYSYWSHTSVRLLGWGKS